MLVAKRWAPNSSPEQREFAMSSNKATGEAPQVSAASGTGDDDLRFGWLQLEPNSRGPVCEAGEGLGSELAGAGQNNIIQKPKTQVEGSCGSSVGESRLQGEREKYGAKRVSLLDPTTGLHDIVGKEETRRRPVTPFSPASDLWQMRASLTEHRRAVDSIKGVANSGF